LGKSHDEGFRRVEKGFGEAPKRSRVMKYAID